MYLKNSNQTNLFHFSILLYSFTKKHCILFCHFTLKHILQHITPTGSIYYLFCASWKILCVRVLKFRYHMFQLTSLSSNFI